MNQFRKKPSMIGSFLLKLILETEEFTERSGDIEEVYYYMSKDEGILRAKLWYWGQLCKAIPVFLFNSIFWSIVMFRNYIRVTMRSMFRYKGYTFINILGLAIGMACAIIILMWVEDELSYNMFHEKIEDIYLVAAYQQHGDTIYRTRGSVPAIGPAIKSEYPEVINSARLSNGQGEMVVSNTENRFTERVQTGDIDLFDIFSFPLIAGDTRTAFLDPHSIMLSRSMADKYFGNEEPVGKVLTLDNKYEMQVTGIFEDIPRHSTIRFDIFVPMEFTRELHRENYPDTWYNLAFRTYALLDKNADVQLVNEKIRGRVKREIAESNTEPYLFPFKDYRLYGLYGRGRIEEIRMFSIIALIVLLIACINFMNLSTARSGRRAKEIGLRKVVGARKENIITQFYGESILLSVIALSIALLMVQLLLPSFNLFTGKDLTIAGSISTMLLSGIVGITVLTGILSGTYPAIFLSSFKPASVLRGIIKSGKGGRVFRKTLVVLQFTLSIALIISTVVIYNQLNFMKSKDMGIQRDQVLEIQLKGPMSDQYESLKQELLRDPKITGITSTNAMITGIYWNGQGWDWDGRDEGTDPLVTNIFTGYDFANTFEIPVADGRYYSAGQDNGNSADINKVVINEAFAELMGEGSAVGKRISGDIYSFIVIGVLKDFNFKPLYRPIEPAMIFLQEAPERTNYMYIKVSGNDVAGALKLIEGTQKKFLPDFPFDFDFIDDQYRAMYNFEQMMGTLFTYFASLAVFISCLGLFGLASYTAEQRTKEIGIRKVLGASIPGVMLLLSKEFTKWVLIANLIAWPVAYFALDKFLQNYAFRVELGVLTFAGSGAAALLIALITISFQSVRSARANPADSLKYE